MSRSGCWREVAGLDPFQALNFAGTNRARMLSVNVPGFLVGETHRLEGDVEMPLAIAHGLW